MIVRSSCIRGRLGSSARTRPGRLRGIGLSDDRHAGHHPTNWHHPTRPEIGLIVLRTRPDISSAVHKMPHAPPLESFATTTHSEEGAGDSTHKTPLDKFG